MNALAAPLRNIGGRRELVLELARRDLRDRHAGQTLGVNWAYGYPSLLMVFYTAPFAYAFPARFGGAARIVDYSPSILAGLISWLAFQDVLSRSPLIILQHGSLVKQVAFPVEVLPVKSVLPSTITYVPALLFTIAYCWWQKG